MDDGPDLAAFVSFPPLAGALVFLQQTLWPAFDAADKAAVRHQTLHRRLASAAAIGGSLAVLSGILQLGLPRLTQLSWLRGGDIIAAIVAVAAVVLGLRAGAQFRWLLQRHQAERLRGTHEILARAIHEDYLRQQHAAGVKPEQNSSMVPWDALPEHLQEANRQQADDIGVKLQAVRCSAAPMVDWSEPLFAFTPAEIERLAVMEHDRWMAAKRQAGWRHGATKDNDAKTHPCLVPYDQLPPDEQDKDRSAVRQIPATLAKVGFRAHRLNTPHRETVQTPNS